MKLNNYYHLTQFSIFIVQGTKERTRLHTKKTEKRECTARLSKENDRDNYFIESENWIDQIGKGAKVSLE